MIGLIVAELWELEHCDEDFPVAYHVLGHLIAVDPQSIQFLVEANRSTDL